MKKRFSEEQIIGILREGEADGAVIRDIAASTILRNRRREATGNPIPMSLPGYRLLCAMTTPPSFATVVPPKTEYRPTTTGRHLHEPVVGSVLVGHRKFRLSRRRPRAAKVLRGCD